MNYCVVARNRRNNYSGGRLVLRLFALLICCNLTAPAQYTAQRGDGSVRFSIRAIHLLGFENAKSNCSGTLSIQDSFLQFQQTGKIIADINIGSVRDVFLGEESRQVGGLPLTLGKAAAPCGGGRVVSLFSHKNYDTVTLEYLDSDGGIHGAIFQLAKKQGEVVKNELMAELKKTKQFQQVVRDSDRKASDIPNLLVLKATVEKYTPDLSQFPVGQTRRLGSC
jgi:hypothetical protein